MKKFIYLCVAAMFCAFTIHNLEAQVQVPAASPLSTLVQDVGLTKIEITYSRPGVKDRVIFGDLIPYGQFWRTGANAPTKVTFADDVMIAGKELKSGSYSLFTYPGEDEWTVIFSNATSLPGPDGYDKSHDAVRINVPVGEHQPKIETFTIDVNNIRNNTATIDLIWENTIVSIPVAFNTDEQVFASIENVMNGPSSNDYHAASSYYLTAGKDLDKALTWATKAVEMTDAKYPWVIFNKAQIEAALGKKADAIKTAQQGVSAAKGMSNDYYQNLLEDFIKELEM